MYDFDLRYMKSNYKREFKIMNPRLTNPIYYFCVNHAKSELVIRCFLEWEIRYPISRAEKVAILLDKGYSINFANWFVDYVEVMSYEFYMDHLFGRYSKRPKLIPRKGLYLSELNKYLRGGIKYDWIY